MKVIGNCEYCEHDYYMELRGDNAVCPNCNRETYNWSNEEGNDMAPSVITIKQG